MLSRFSPSGLRGRLVAVIVVIAAAVLGASFYVLHERTGSDLEKRVDRDLQSDLDEFNSSGISRSSSASDLQKRAREFVDSQAYHPDSRIFAIQIGAGDDVVTNSEELIESELGREEPGEATPGVTESGILSARAGFDTVSAGDEADVRVLSQPVQIDGRVVGSFHVAQSLSQIATAQDSLQEAFLVVGAIALLVLILAAAWISTLLTRPLDEIASFAAGVDRGELDRRLDSRSGSREVKSLSSSLNRMLDRLQRAFEREREFVADASHELRTPVTVAKGELDLLRREVDERERERLDVVRRELGRMERLIAEMLSLAREDAGRSLEIRRVPVNDLLDDLRRDLPLLGPRSYQVDELEGTVALDPDRVAQVFRNLTRNAVAHTGEGGVVSVSVRASGDSVRFDVRDDGPGIQQEEADHLFERFYRSPKTRARDVDGSGLGLAIARAIVEAHGGTIWAEPGPGGRVSFELPGYDEAPIPRP